MSTESDLEVLSAFLDEELSQAEMQKVRERLVSDPEFRAAYDALKTSDEALLGFAAQIDTTPLPADTSRLIAADEPPAQRAYGFFASAAAVVLLLGGYFVMQEQPAGYAWLDSLESGKVVDTPEGAAQVIASFRHADGRYCREAETAGRRGIFCRTAGNWQLMVETQTNHAPSGTYAPAGNNGVNNVDAYVSENMAGMVLTAEQERSAIDSHWQ